MRNRFRYVNRILGYLPVNRVRLKVNNVRVGTRYQDGRHIVGKVSHALRVFSSFYK